MSSISRAVGGETFSEFENQPEYWVTIRVAGNITREQCAAWQRQLSTTHKVNGLGKATSSMGPTESTIRLLWNGDVQELAAEIDFAKVTAVDVATRTITVAP
ncbi:MAG: hypothetical protein EHM42_07695 [Planctomycetaceae bacterium]|nr:MAG: hypothetical protein EHM42_07695 [Planctomycetaceae bacterium]